jgi:hypothetical protein
MANGKHLSVLGMGPDYWNSWRQENEDVIPNLSGASLRDGHLWDQERFPYDTDLGDANLCGTNLKGADLSIQISLMDH